MTGDRLALPERTLASRLVVVARAQRAEDYDAVLEVLADAGIRSVELTLTTPGTFDHLPRLRDAFGDRLDLGVGTVVDEAQLDRAVAGGAAYLVTPITSTSLVRRAVEAGVPIVPGGLTPTELFSSWSAGASAVKVFPAGQVGPGYLSDLRGPFPDIRAVPSGGVDLAGATAWLDAGALAVSVGGPLLGDAFRGGDLGALRERAEAFVRVTRGADA
ncbi:bifunctional 4-hydroxy-2-oxoglutarate aldolase/2-dehydro-3-deoxy-phosphogluconate aldolase [Microbacterium sp. EYE_5]|uniref:bifunctional 4-hydroxy-2-oxoglutarate aldolase/2-dehydro-3-deoxy-phosphogluconate aldolase n=1 Tax=unclassified Microbacterium TaxID=2609290 RepID=UPI002002F8CB|nr:MULTISPECIES: bifunctional 4-hydroxy-2-oxoglutarate aldolase/2-dehydro-3-deoxy-phosphogluconate aldolase [unclassified Microbacterium]MCK6079828.1 bifunctional 4-hydroxy-2-oxoglutarate aldolase/2-dehydro-3-deoxy-phosphogluconate aldolase [Microbacterium sp. EYE_382]MCK6085099.1 bifunctional 4-hydroxy-2-oxoglutarate aldolase/2-dehydro-3-deoxy-phosphogluconate aldolase [Microbacterium sp. EYE_384]MCK6122675.1 bifunctional 4-hydroxy-2-oxoglutarate aldolase/2-dehydro-3-deoxy-phosphogluconate aldo